MPPSRQAVSALSANDVAFAADDVAGCKSADVRPDLNDFTDKFMADDQADRYGLPRPFIPFVDMKVRSADPRSLDADQDVIDTNRRPRNFLKAKAGSADGLD
jgi:hypothetical protein